jgi:hypothetical protein
VHRSLLIKLIKLFYAVYEIIVHAGVGDSVYKAIFLEIKVTERDPRSDKNMLRIFLTFGLLHPAQQLIFSFHPNALSLSAEKGGRLRKFTLT